MSPPPKIISSPNKKPRYWNGAETQSIGKFLKLNNIDNMEDGKNREEAPGADVDVHRELQAIEASVSEIQGRDVVKYQKN